MHVDHTADPLGVPGSRVSKAPVTVALAWGWSELSCSGLVGAGVGSAWEDPCGSGIQGRGLRGSTWM